MPRNPNPSYGTGFARNKAESAFPEMWDELVAAYAAFLGPSGRLVDWSGNHNNLILTGGTWIRKFLNFDGATDSSVTSGQKRLDITGDLTLVWGMTPNYNTGIDYGREFITFGAAGENESQNVLYWVDPFFSRFEVLWEYGAGTNITPILSDALIAAQGVFAHYAITRSVAATSDVAFWKNGAQHGATDTGNTNPSGGGDGELLVGDTLGGASSAIDLMYLYIYNRTLTGGEIAEIHASPKKLFIRNPRALFVPVVANDLLLLQNTNLRGNLQDLRGGLR